MVTSRLGECLPMFADLQLPSPGLHAQLLQDLTDLRRNENVRSLREPQPGPAVVAELRHTRDSACNQGVGAPSSGTAAAKAMQLAPAGTYTYAARPAPAAPATTIGLASAAALELKVIRAITAVLAAIVAPSSMICCYACLLLPAVRSGKSA